MSSVQKKSRCRRQASSNAWPQTLTGFIITRILPRSTFTSWPESSSALAVEGTTLTCLSLISTTFLPSPESR
ncbi:hypothetical protein D3C85_1867900 [compost metagenome]